MKIGCFTICSRNYLAYALNLRDSLREVAPDLTLNIFLADEPLEATSTEVPEIINVSSLGISNILDMAFRYNVVEFNTAIKPLCFEYMFD
jgi:N12 class adenine-specific DNA methylase